MGNNNEIRKRMETCHIVLSVLLWIVGIIGMFFGLLSGNGEGIVLFIASIFGTIIGHFLVNVGLTIPFILLNNGDYLAAIVPEEKIIKGAES